MIFAGLIGPVAAAPAERPWRVVILNDGDPTLPGFVALDRSIRAELTAPGRPRVDFFHETLDMLRFPKALFEAELSTLLKKKYAALPVDAVVAIGSPSLDFAERHRDQLWPNAVILFQGVPAEFLRERKLSPTTTGFAVQHDLAGVADLALMLQPSMRRLIVVSGSGDYDRIMARVARVQLDSHAERVAIEHWENVPLDEAIRRVAELERDSAVLYLAVNRDTSGRSFAPAEAAKLVAAASSVPTYGHLETFIGEGIVGGTMYSFAARGKRMGELVHEVLSNRSRPLPPLLTPQPSTCIADAMQVERFGLSLSQLPPGCEVRFLPSSLWRDYRWHVLAAMIVILMQSALILGLVLQRRGRVKAEGEVRDRRAELAQASRLALAGELTASIAHEINQPLGAILANAGAAEALLRRDPSASSELREILADIRKADLRASEIIRRVRSLITTRQAEREPVEVNAMVSDILTFLRGDAQRRGVVIDIELTPGLPTLLVDRVQMQQAVVNLCVNAMEAMSDCAAEKRLGVRTAATADGDVEITVSDSGPGVPPEYLARMFDSFFTTKAHGMGLGLAIARSIVEAHEGTMSAENRKEGGALFRIVLPARADVVQ